MIVPVKKVWIDAVAVYIETTDGKVFSEQFENYYRLRNATTKQRSNFEYDNIGIHWEDIDEDLSFEGFVRPKTERNTNLLYNVFKENRYLNVSEVARKMGIPQSVMASYICGIKKPSPQRKTTIEKTLHEIGKNLMKVKI